MTAAIRKAIAQYDAACQAAEKRIQSEWSGRILAVMSPPLEERIANARVHVQAEFTAAKLALAAQFNIPSNLA
jgi:hypothetical protein